MTHLLKTPTQRSIALMLVSLVFFASNTLLVRGLALQVPGAEGWMTTLLRAVAGLGLVPAFWGRAGWSPWGNSR